MEDIYPQTPGRREKKQTEKQSETLKDLAELKKLNPDSAVETASDKQTSLHCVTLSPDPPTQSSDMLASEGYSGLLKARLPPCPWVASACPLPLSAKRRQFVSSP